MSIRLVTRQDIDDEKWDACIHRAANGLAYAKISFLDLMTDQWCAVILNDYQAVMPIPFRTKWGITYVYQPAFIQQLGLIGEFNPEQLQACVDVLKEQIRYGNLPLNFSNPMEGASAAANYVLDLSKPYADIASQFTYYLRRTTKEDKTADLLYKVSASYERTIHLYRDRYGQRFPHVHVQSYNGLIKFAEQFPDQVLLREAWRKDELLSAILLLRDERRLYLLISINTPEGKKAEANRFLLNQLIREFSETPLLLDFEGSDIPGVAAYYEGYGAVLQSYYILNWNHLPAPIRWLKK
jgi:hypothetical protein